MFYFNPFSIPNLISAISCLAIGVFTFAMNSKSKVNRIFFVQAITACIWQLGTFLILISKEASYVIFWARFTYLGAIFIPFTAFHLAAEFLNRKEIKKFVYFGYLLGFFIFLPLSRTSYFINGTYSYFWGNWFKAGSLHPLFLVFFTIYMLSAFVCLFLNYKEKDNKIERIRFIYLIVAYSLVFPGITDFFPDYGINIYPIGSISVFLFILTVSYAIARHRLMDIEVVIKKTVMFAGIFTFVFMIFAGVTFFTQEFLVALLGDNTRYVVFFFSVLLITIGIRPLEKFLTHATDKFLFQKKYDYQQTLKDASEGMTLVTDMKKLLNFIVRVVTKKVRIKSAVIFQYEDGKDRYILRIRRGTHRKNTGYCLDKDNVLVSWLREHREAILIYEIEDWLKSERFLHKEKHIKEKLIDIKEELLGMDGVICVPSFSKGYLIGFLVLGEKLSGDIYTQEDVRLLSTLANSAAVAVENSKNFMELQKVRERERESYIQTVLALAQTVDEKDSYTHGHLESVTQYGLEVAKELKGSSEFKADINMGDLETSLRLHDIGKIGVPDAILNKGKKLNASEWKLMKQHCEIGARIVEPIGKLKNVGNIIKHHQERYDGSGYPDGLKGEEIPIESRIITVVDAYHAMISNRPYRKALPESTALTELRKNIGTQFDPVAVSAFFRAHEKGKIKKI